MNIETMFTSQNLRILTLVFPKTQFASTTKLIKQFFMDQIRLLSFRIPTKSLKHEMKIISPPTTNNRKIRSQNKRKIQHSSKVKLFFTLSIYMAIRNETKWLFFVLPLTQRSGLEPENFYLLKFIFTELRDMPKMIRK